MSSYEIAGGIKNLQPGPLDALRGPYPNIAAACAAIPSVDIGGLNFRLGKIVDIGIAPNLVTYWWAGGFADAHLVPFIEVTASQFGPVKAFSDFMSTVVYSQTDQHPHAFTDNNNRLLFWADFDGFFNAFKYALNSIKGNALVGGSVTPDKLDASIISSLWTPLDPETGYVGAFLDANGRIIWAARLDGTLYVPKLEFVIKDGTIKFTMLDSATQALINNGSVNINERVIADDDNGFRGKLIDAGANTSLAGALFKQLPRFRTPVIQGINTSGQIIEIRKSNNMVFRGEQYIGTFSPDPAINDIRYRGLNMSTSDTTISSTGAIPGDYYKIGTASGSPRLVNGISCYNGDLLVWNGTIWQRKPAPPGTNSNSIGAWWVVTSAGTFDGVSYSIGDHIYILAHQTGGGPVTKHLAKGGDLEFFFVSEFNPASDVLPSANNFEVYIASNAGTYSGISFNKYDYLVRINGTWQKITSEPVISVPANGFVSLKCDYADEFEFRRADVSNSAIPFPIKIRSAFYQKQPISSIFFTGDSMVSTGGLSATLESLIAPRAITSLSYGGATFKQVVSMIKYLIKNGDPHRGKVHVLFAGHNNYTNPVHSYEAVLDILNLIGARDKRFLFMSAVGVRDMIWTGSRIASSVQEEANTNTGPVWAFEQMLNNLVPGNMVNGRQAIITSAASLNTPDPTYPGMTEAQVAATYGVTPFSYYFNYAARPFTAAQLNFTGYRSAAGLPIGGNDYDYFLRSANGEIGNLIVKTGGIWAEYSWDRIHMNNTGTTPLANLIANWLTTNNL